MDYGLNTLKESIKYIGRLLNKEEVYITLLNDHTAMPEMTKIVPYDIFLHENVIQSTNNGKSAKKIIKQYCLELQKNGTVIFGENDLIFLD